MMKKKYYVNPTSHNIEIDLSNEILAVSGNGGSNPNNISADNWQQGNTDWFGTEKKDNSIWNESSIWK